MKVRNINEKDFDSILKLDKQVYPTENPVTKKILKKWYSKNPEFGLIYEKNESVSGLCIAIPLNKSGWEKLVLGNISEADLDESLIFDKLRDSQIAIHVYHIEKLDDKIESFHNIVLKDLNEVISNLRIRNPLLKVVGFSGLCVTPSGIELFKNKLNCKERTYFSSEYIFVKNNKKYLFNLTDSSKILTLIKEGYVLVNRCNMLVSFPSEKSIIWENIVA